MHKKNHFVPAFHLKQWYVDHGFFGYEFHAESRKFSRARCKNHGDAKCWLPELYWLDTTDEEWKRSLEKQLSDRENRVAKIYQRLQACSDYQVTPEEQRELLFFILQLKHRAPHIVNDLKSKATKEKDSKLVKERAFKKGVSSEEFDQLVDSEPSVKEYIQNLSLLLLEGEESEEAALNKLMEKVGPKAIIAYIGVPQSHYSLITSNFPVAQGRGLFSKEGYDIVFPLWPHKLFCVISEKSLEAYQEIKRSLQKREFQAINNLVINTNIGMLRNHEKQPLAVPYQIYSKTGALDEVLPPNLIPDYFQSAASST